MNNHDEHRRLAAVVCLPCRKSKRRCEGGFPCTRCKEKEKEEDCVQVFPKKRGRKPAALRDAIAQLDELPSSPSGGRKKRSDASTASPTDQSPDHSNDHNDDHHHHDHDDHHDDEHIVDVDVQMSPLRAPPSPSACEAAIPSMGSQEVYHVQVTAELPPKYEITDEELGLERTATMRVLVQYASRALVDRPKEVAASFGAHWLDSSCYICVQLPPKHTYGDTLEAFLHGRVVSAVQSADQPKFAEIFLDPRVCVGRRIVDMALQKSGVEREMMRNCFRAPPHLVGKCFVRRMRFPKTIFSELYCRPVELLLESTMFMDEESYPNFLFMTIVEVLAPPPPMEPPAMINTAPAPITISSVEAEAVVDNSNNSNNNNNAINKNKKVDLAAAIASVSPLAPFAANAKSFQFGWDDGGSGNTSASSADWFIQQLAASTEGGPVSGKYMAEDEVFEEMFV